MKKMPVSMIAALAWRFPLAAKLPDVGGVVFQILSMAAATQLVVEGSAGHDQLVSAMMLAPYWREATNLAHGHGLASGSSGPPALAAAFLASLLILATLAIKGAG